MKGSFRGNLLSSGSGHPVKAFVFSRRITIISMKMPDWGTSQSSQIPGIVPYSAEFRMKWRGTCVDKELQHASNEELNHVPMSQKVTDENNAGSDLTKRFPGAIPLPDRVLESDHLRWGQLSKT
jgi:hypothetical protein